MTPDPQGSAEPAKRVAGKESGHDFLFDVLNQGMYFFGLQGSP